MNDRSSWPPRPASERGPQAADLLAALVAAPGARLLLAADPPRFTIVAASDEYLVATMTTREALAGRPLFEVFPDANPANPTPSGVANLRASLEAALRTARPHAMPVQRYDLRRPDGTWEVRHWAPRNVPVPGAGGEVRWLVHHVDDVTATVLGQASLASAEASASRVLERISDAHVTLDREFRFRSVNPAAERLLGKRRDELLGRSHWDVFPASVNAEPGRAYRRVVAEGVERHFAQHYVGEGYDMHVEVDAYPTDEGGVAIFWRDVTGRVHAEAAIRDSESRFRAVAEQGEVGIAVTDHDARFVYVNDRYCSMLGRAREAILGRAVRDLTHPDDWAHNAPLLARALAGGEPFTIEKRYRRPNGSEVWVRNCVSARRDAGGAPIGAMAVSLDLTDRIRAEEALREADRRKDEFLAMLAHELRNPLAPLANAHRLLERTEALSDRGLQALALAQRQMRHLRRLVDDLLEVSRITRGKIEIRPEPMELGQAVRAAVDSLAAMAEQRAQRVAVSLPERPVRIHADPVRIAQVLENLLTNASKYTPDGGAVRVEVEDPPGEAVVRVIDDGTGIDPAKIGRLFELFHQLDATLDRAQGGLGIGLALVKRLVELHGGTVAAASDGLGRGATFTVRLPRRLAAEI